MFNEFDSNKYLRPLDGAKPQPGWPGQMGIRNSQPKQYPELEPWWYRTMQGASPFPKILRSTGAGVAVQALGDALSEIEEQKRLRRESRPSMIPNKMDMDISAEGSPMYGTVQRPTPGVTPEERAAAYKQYLAFQEEQRRMAQAQLQMAESMAAANTTASQFGLKNYPDPMTGASDSGMLGRLSGVRNFTMGRGGRYGM